MEASADRVRAAAVNETLASLDAWLLSLPTRARSALTRGIRPKAKHTQLHWAAAELGVRVPHDLRALYGWHNGQSASGSLFDRILAYHSSACALDVVVADPIRGRAFLPLAAMVRRGSITGERLDGAFMRAKFGGNYGDSYMSYCFGTSNGAEVTHFLPFAELSLSVEGEEPEGMQLYLETTGGAVLAFDADHDDADHIIEVAPSLATFLGEPLDRMQRGLVELPSAKAPPRTPRQNVHAGEALLGALLEARIVELTEGVNMTSLADTLRDLLSLRRNPNALHTATAFLMNDPRISEIFVEDEELQRLVAEFLGR